MWPLCSIENRNKRPLSFLLAIHGKHVEPSSVDVTTEHITDRTSGCLGHCSISSHIGVFYVFFSSLTLLYSRSFACLLRLCLVYVVPDFWCTIYLMIVVTHSFMLVVFVAFCCCVGFTLHVIYIYCIISLTCNYYNSC